MDNTSYSADSIRLPRAAALALCLSCPEALAALCRVLWFCRVSGVCFAALATLRVCGLPLSAAVLRRGLLQLLDRGILASGISAERCTVSYAPTDALPRTDDSVFIPPQVWRGCKPTELAVWVAWRLSHGQLGAGQLGLLVAGRCGKTLSLRQSYTVLRTLRDRGFVQCDAGAKSEAPAVRKTNGAQCENQLPNTDVSKTETPNTEENQFPAGSDSSGGRGERQLTGKGLRLVLLPCLPPDPQLSFSFAGPARAVEVPVSLYLDWLEASPPLRAAAPVPTPSGEAVDRQPAQRPPTQPPTAMTLPSAFRALCYQAPIIRPPRVLPTPTGLPQAEERDLTKGWADAEMAGYLFTDLAGLWDWVNAGHLARRSSPRQWLCQNLCTALLDAEQWRKSGSQVPGAPRSAQPQPEVFNPNDAASQLTRRTAKAASR